MHICLIGYRRSRVLDPLSKKVGSTQGKKLRWNIFPPEKKNFYSLWGPPGKNEPGTKRRFMWQFFSDGPDLIVKEERSRLVLDFGCWKERIEQVFTRPQLFRGGRGELFSLFSFGFTSGDKRYQPDNEGVKMTKFILFKKVFILVSCFLIF